MRPAPPSFFPLDGRTGWRTADAGAGGQAPEHVRVDPGGGLRLAARPDGPIALDAPDGSLGQLVLPASMALDEAGILYLLTSSPWFVRRFDSGSRGFVTLPALGDEGHVLSEAGRDEARRFDDPLAIAVAGGRLYVAERGNRRVQVFATASLALVHLWTLEEPAGLAVDRGCPGHEGRESAVYLLDRGAGRVLRHRPGSTAPEVVINDASAVGRWTQIAVDRDGNLYLLATAAGEVVLEIYGRDGRRRGEARGAGEVRSRFEPPAVTVDFLGRFFFPALKNGGAGEMFDRHGCPTRVQPDEVLGPEAFETSGTWWSQALDSEIYQCQWHRIELELDALPPGTEVRVGTSAWQDSEPDAPAWETAYRAIGPLQPSPEEADSEPDELGHEFLVGSLPGRFLRLRLELFGDGDHTPVVRALRVHYPRQPYLEHLPAIYSAEDSSRDFLEGFLSITQTEWDEVERRIAEIARLFDPDAAPPEFLEYLASWLALPLEGSWNTEQKRRLLAAAPSFYPRRGTPDGLAAVVAVYLENMTGIAAGEAGWPVVVEGFRERRRLLLGLERGAELGPAGAPLWSPAAVARFQLGGFSRTGEARLVSTDDPERDLFHEHAHRFRVFVPSAWVRGAEDETMLRRAIDAEKPAHTSYDLCLVEPLLRVGIQSTLGIDTLIGDWPEARLGDCGDVPPSRPPRHRLGFDTVLGRGGDATLGTGARAGVDTALM